MTKKVVLRLGVHDEKARKKAMKAVSSASGVESLMMDMKEKKLTVVGAVDPVEVFGKLNKYWWTELLTVGPAKEPEKKVEAAKKESEPPVDELVKLYQKHYPYQTEYYYYPAAYTTAEENPNCCVIC